MRNKDEYIICRQISIWLRIQYPEILFHFDYAGLNHSKAQAGMMKAIQGERGFPDLCIFEPRGNFHGLFVEIKKDGEKLFNKKGKYRTPHLTTQADMIKRLIKKGYYSEFGIGFSNCKDIIENYLKL